MTSNGYHQTHILRLAFDHGRSMNCMLNSNSERVYAPHIKTTSCLQMRFKSFWMKACIKMKFSKDFVLVECSIKNFYVSALLSPVAFLTGLFNLLIVIYWKLLVKYSLYFFSVIVQTKMGTTVQSELTMKFHLSIKLLKMCQNVFTILLYRRT